MRLTNSLSVLLALVSLSSADNAADPVENYLVYFNYCAVVVENSVSTYTPTIYDCVAYATVTPQTNGVSYNTNTKQCKVLPATNHEIQIQLRVNTGWVTYVKDISNKPRLLFKATGYITPDNNQTSLNYIFTGSASSNVLTTNYSAAMSPNCSCLYRNAFIDYWVTSSVTKITVTLYSNDIAVASFVYNGVGNGNTGWYSKSYLIATYPYDYQAMRLFSFTSYSFTGDGTRCCPLCFRSFLMSASNSNCATDSYYFLTSNEINCCMTYYVTNMYPNIIYSASKTYEVASGAGSLKADYMTISGTIGSRIYYV